MGIDTIKLNEFVVYLDKTEMSAWLVSDGRCLNQDAEILLSVLGVVPLEVLFFQVFCLLIPKRGSCINFVQISCLVFTLSVA